MLPPGEAFDASPFGEGPGAEKAEEVFRRAQLLSRFFRATLATEPFTVDESGSGEVPTHWRVHRSIDRLVIERLSCLTLGEERTTPRLNRACPFGATRRRSFGQSS